MVSKLKTLLLAGLALPLAAGLALAQSTPATSIPSAAAAEATAAAPAQSAKQPGALRATPAEKKAGFEKTGLKRGSKPHSLAAKHPKTHKARVASKAEKTGGVTTKKPGSAGPETPAKSQ